MIKEIKIRTHKREELIDITKEVELILREETRKKEKEKEGEAEAIEGLCNVFVPHATAAIIINENYDPEICNDLLSLLKEKIPKGIWRHDRIDGNADSHLKASILGPGETIPYKNGKLMLGTWQSIMLAELDGPRERRIIITTIKIKN